MIVTCPDCGATFYRKAEEPWRIRCLSCWLEHKETAPRRQARADPDYKTLWQRADAENYRLTLRVADLERQLAARTRSPIEAELRDNLPRLVQLAHPDRHGNSAAATVATQWLLNVRQRLNS